MSCFHPCDVLSIEWLVSKKRKEEGREGERERENKGIAQSRYKKKKKKRIFKRFALYEISYPNPLWIK